MTAQIVTDPITLDVQAGQTVTLRHGLGRQVGGWIVVWADAPVQLTIADPEADTRQELALVASASARVRLVLL